MSDIQNYTEIEKLATCDYLAKLVTVRNIPNVKLDAVCLDVTKIVKLVATISNDYKYYLVPDHDAERLDCMYHKLHKNQTSYRGVQRVFAAEFYEIIKRFCFNKYAFSYFKIYVIDPTDESIKDTYENDDPMTSNVINKLLEVAKSDLSKYTIYTAPRNYVTGTKLYNAMQYVGFNELEIREWIKDAETIVIDPFTRTDTGLRYIVVECGGQTKHIIINSYVVKIAEKSFAIMAKDVFDAIFMNVITNDVYYNIDSINTMPTKSEDVIISTTKVLKFEIKPNASFDIDVTRGSSRIMIAYPADKPDLTSIYRLDYTAEGDYLDLFTKCVIPVTISGATSNFKVYTLITDEPFYSIAKLRFKF